ncbi:MAG TPA: hypothetical protein PLA68_13415 [Panacibacter sp.]|nr:hypothetical protein [Panacibacter sp.]
MNHLTDAAKTKQAFLINQISGFTTGNFIFSVVKISTDIANIKMDD